MRFKMFLVSVALATATTWPIATAAAQESAQAQQVACDEKCVTRLNDEELPMGAGCARVDHSDGTTGKDCYVDSTMPPGQCEMDFDCGSALASVLMTADGTFLHIGSGCQASVARTYAAMAAGDALLARIIDGTSKLAST